MTDQDDSASTKPAARRRIRRHQVVGGLTALYDDARYLEVGVSKGDTFGQVPAARKVAVDPVLRFDVEQMRRDQPGTEFHSVTSDVYFAEKVAPREKFDVIYLDGLHTFDQTLRDLMNALHHLAPRGVIVVDDTRPTSYAASLPDRDSCIEVKRHLGATGKAWMGDVYRIVYFVEAFCPQLSYRTIEDNHGQTVFWPSRRGPVTERSPSEVATLDFEQFVLTTGSAMRLAPYADIVAELRADLAL